MRWHTTRRWSDNDAHFGPFTLSRDNHKQLGLVLDSGSDEYPGCNLRLNMVAVTLICELPPVIRPALEQVTGKYNYTNVWPREYGFAYWDGFLRIFHGQQTHDSRTDKLWSVFLPWTQWRLTEKRLFGKDGQLEFSVQRTHQSGFDFYEEFRQAAAEIYKAHFLFRDYDGEEIRASCYLEEYVYEFGEGQFKWLSFFCRSRIRRSMAISFSAEVGPRKGSWKGGAVGHGIEMESPDELHEAAFRRYCDKHSLVFLRAVLAPTRREA